MGESGVKESFPSHRKHTHTAWVAPQKPEYRLQEILDEAVRKPLPYA